MTNDELVSELKSEKLKFYNDFWKQYIALEKLFLETEKYVTISKDNAKAYSIQYNIILQAICSEVDVVIKRLCYEYDSLAEVDNMWKYVELILLHDPKFKDVKVKLDLYNMEFEPWQNIEFKQIKDRTKLIVPYWWDGYLKVKHNRLIFYKTGNEFKISERNIKQANQNNVLGALAGLYVLEIRCLEKMNERFIKKFEENCLPIVTIDIYDEFNKSIFQEDVHVIECL